MKYLSPELPWEKIRAIGFDLDGTLYDEFEFISAVYFVLAGEIAEAPADRARALNFMLARWLEKGSSYPHIFAETMELLGVEPGQREARVPLLLEIFRQFQPKLTLSPRMEFLLADLVRHYALFMVSDGGSVLQRSKLDALQLSRYFRAENIFISGEHGPGAAKPSVVSVRHIAALAALESPSQVAFVGDRERDREYATRCGFHFVHISELFRRL